MHVYPDRGRVFRRLCTSRTSILVLSTEKKIYAVIRHVANMVAGVGAGIIFLGTLFNILKVVECVKEVLEETEDDAELCRKIDMSRSSSPARSRRSRRRRGSRRSDKSAHSSNVEIDGASEDASPGSSSRSRSPVATNSRSQSPVSLSGPRSSSNSPSSRRKWTRKLPNSTKRIHIMTLPQKKIKLPIVDERASLERVDERASPLSMHETVSSRNSSNSLAHEKHSEPLYGEEVGDSKASLNGDLETTNAALVTRPGTRTSAGSSSGVASDSAVSSLSNADLIKSVKEKPDSRGSASAGRDSESLASDRKLLVSLGALVAEGVEGANRKGRMMHLANALSSLAEARSTHGACWSEPRTPKSTTKGGEGQSYTANASQPEVRAQECTMRPHHVVPFDDTITSLDTSTHCSKLILTYSPTTYFGESIEEERCKYDFMYDLLYWVHLGFLGYMQHWGRIEENHHANNEHHRPGRGK
eukprot:jgi/Bigna1/70597/fgenesh1_pg.12_\